MVERENVIAGEIFFESLMVCVLVVFHHPKLMVTKNQHLDEYYKCYYQAKNTWIAFIASQEKGNLFTISIYLHDSLLGRIEFVLPT